MGCERPHNNEEVGIILNGLKVCLWDIYKSALRENDEYKQTSKDSDIDDVEWNDILGILHKYVNIKRIGVLGKKAYKDFVKKYPDIKEQFPHIEVKCLPSTSGSNGAQWGGKPIDRSRIGWIKFSEIIEWKSR